MLRLELLPAGRGDCVWLEFGNPRHPRIVLIDGGIESTAPLLERRIRKAMRQRGVSLLHIDLLVVTHIDTDHIDGILALFERDKVPLSFGDIWFNGERQLSNLLGPAEGDRLSKLLQQRQLPWNDRFGGAPVMVPDDGELPKRELCDGLQLTLLGPTEKRLEKLAEAWQKVLGEFDKIEAPDQPERPDLLGRHDTWPPTWREQISYDHAPANGSSITLIAEHEGQKILLTGDAFATDIAKALARFRKERRMRQEKIVLEAFKLAHHGSARNLSKRLLEQIDCRRYLISTDGSGHLHPDHQALLRILRYSTPRRPCLMFNYDCPTTRVWRDRKDDIVRSFPDYDIAYPEDPEQGSVIQVMPPSL